MNKTVKLKLASLEKDLAPLHLQQQSEVWISTKGKDIVDNPELTKSNEIKDLEPEKMYRVRYFVQEPMNVGKYLKDLYNKGGMELVQKYFDFVMAEWNKRLDNAAAVAKQMQEAKQPEKKSLLRALIGGRA